MSVRVGIDLVTVEQVQEAIAEHGERYLSRVYTERERRESRYEPRRLAARFAAKEATMKALGRGNEGFGWRSIAVAAGDSGQPTIELTGAVRDLADRRGVSNLTVSLTHEAAYAAAVVVAEVAP
jgi:holo-[acyl-carrier protein] synthase